MPTNRQQLLDNRPDGEAVASNFKLVSVETPPLKDNQVLVRHHYMEIIWQPFLIAHSIPAMIQPSAPLPRSLRTLPT